VNGSTSYTLAPRRAPHNALEAILEATRARPSGRDSWTGHCPAHEDRDPSLSIRVTSEGRVLLYCFAGCPFEAILAALGLEARDLMGETTPGPVLYRYREPESAPDEQRRRALERLWSEAVPLDRPAAEVARRYLEARGLDPAVLLPGLQGLRVHPGLEYREGERVLGRFPALLARVERPGFGLAALHRTYLAPDGTGKAPVPAPKRLTPPLFPGATRGAAVRLYRPEGGRLWLTEGIETALAVRQATGGPVWACVSAGGLEAVELPREVVEVVVAADHDEAGLKAARALAARLLGEGRQVRLAVPPRAGADWLDALNGAQQGVAGAPITPAER